MDHLLIHNIIVFKVKFSNKHKLCFDKEIFFLTTTLIRLLLINHILDLFNHKNISNLIVIEVVTNSLVPKILCLIK